MECNKDEAIRAKDIAERKMQNGDFEGARRIAMKARQLYSELENISQMLMVCEVHCSAQNKLYGSEMDWYAILQIERFSDEAVIKKQYRKFALSLHPDKNKFAGAEAAFKLIGEANRVLTDPAKRSLYDMKCKGTVRPAPKPMSHQPNRNTLTKKQQETLNKFASAPSSQYMSSPPYQQPQRPTFWTCCSSCNMRYQYYRELQNKTLRCQNCKKSFIAIDLGVQGVPIGTPWSQFPNHNGVPQGPSKVFPQNNSGKPSGAGFPDRFRPVDIGGSSKLNDLKAGNTSKNGGDSKPQEKANGYMNVGVEAQKEDTKIPKSGSMKPKQTRTSKGASRKRGRKFQVESSESLETGSSDSSEENVVNGEYSSGHCSGPSGGHHRRRSSRQKQNISYNEDLTDADFADLPPKRSRLSRSSSVIEEEMKEAGPDDGVPKGDTLADAVDRNKKEAQQKPTSTHEESLSNKKTITGESKTEGVKGPMPEKAFTLGKANAEPENNDRKPKVDDKSDVFADEADVSVCPDPDFSNFDDDKAGNCFAVDQVWAMYDPMDSMPRFYARVKKVFSPGFKLLITWLETSPDVIHEKEWCDKDLPVACGKFRSGRTQRTSDRMSFSHQMNFSSTNNRGNYFIYPRKGETWALFKDWDMNWSSEPKKHGPPYRYEFVEVLSEFDENFGIGVAYLRKVKGFVSIFQQADHNGVIQFCIPPDELYKFSHRVPSFRMTGKEREGVPAGSFELDPASLPSNLDDYGDPMDAKLEKENLDDEPTNLCSQSPKSKLKSTKASKICMPEKNEIVLERGSSMLEESTTTTNGTGEKIEIIAGLRAKNKDGEKVNPDHVNLVQLEGKTASLAKERVESPKKQDKRKLAADALAPRRSSRDMSKRNIQVNAGLDTSGADSEENIAANSNLNHMQPSSISSLHDDKVLSPVKDGSTGLTMSPISSGRRVVEVESHDFRREKSENKFEREQIWAIYSNEDGLPRNYGLIKGFDSSPNFKLQVAMLEPISPKDARRPICCGLFRVKIGPTKAVSVSKFSHQLKADISSKNKYDIRPRKGEIWAVYKSNPESACSGQSKSACYIVEVLEDDARGVKVIMLVRARCTADNFFYWAPRIQRSKTGVLDISRSEFARFSHQCSAFKHPRGYWEVDPASMVSGTVILLD